ncbi:hypothetical protein [Actinomadura macrotermitis]|uniref:Uncharacterized protein n=1 Tax=Actinomadura macrotermitis TaxID=2585200 RepID=A0A7K0BYV4_9ACTN|nr:hypothetical protein [Actinomadura macrotermitis]MQY05834.1 hypothetical protein [Actinomadura macrotermitis]
MTPERKAPLEALGMVLRAHKLQARMNPDGLHVLNPHVDGCCGPHPSDVVSVRPREDDGGRLWFYTSWGHPFAEADRITDAVLTLKELLNGKPGVAL